MGRLARRVQRYGAGGRWAHACSRFSSSANPGHRLSTARRGARLRHHAYDPQIPGTLLSNFVITVNGDTATAWSRWAFVVPNQQGGGAAISQAGRYDDELVRENGRWKFKKRVASNDTGGPRPAAK